MTNLSNEEMYWSGFILADGYVKPNYLTVELAQKDINHLNKLEEFLGKCRRYTRTKKNTVGLSCSKDFSWLTNNGIESPKTYSSNVNIDYFSNFHFIRGLYDGDGSLYETSRGIKRKDKKQMKISIVTGSLEIVEGVREFAISNIRKDVPRVYEEKNYYRFIMSRQSDLKIFLSLVYQNAPQHIRLERKYETSLSFLSA
jgi:intein/homing endonuclease